LELSSPRFKSIAVTAGLSFWFFIITISFSIFTIELFLIFITSLFVVTQIFARKLSKGLDIFAQINTKIFLGILFIFVISLYGILFRILRIDPLRLQKHEKSYWLKLEHLEGYRIYKQY